MTLNERLARCAVIGAAGKMGRGIALLLAQLCAEQGNCHLTLLDNNSDALEGLRSYLQTHLEKAEEKTGKQGLAERALAAIRFSSSYTDCKGCRLVFEAALENEEAKQEIFRTLNGICAKECYYLSNTSSLPIGGLEETCGMKGRLMGFHFYNPPPVQKLVEVITTEHTLKDLVHLSEELGKRLRKILIPSRDIAGFIGNGHFMRDLLYACEQAKKLAKQHGVAEGIMMMQRVTQDFLLRPMGIFQLADYVGLDVCRNILAIMDTHSEESLRSPLIERMLQQGIRGGQLPDGSQKDGFLRYEGKRITGVYDPDRGGYVEWESMEAKVNERLGPLPASHQSWKELLASKERATLLQSYFAQLWEMDSLGADLARQYLQKSRSIALQLREEGVAHAIDDVNAVMEYGFYHLYGPVSDLIPQTQLSKTESI